MRLLIGEMAKASGVTVRTLHHYDAIGLLCPGKTNEAGYRCYGEKEALRLQQILLLRALDFPLEEIGRLLDNPAFDREDALKKQRALLEARREELGHMITFIDRQLKGETIMDFEAFDMTKEEQLKEAYRQEAQERYGQTKEYQESARREKGRTPKDTDQINALANEIFARFGAAAKEGVKPGDARANALVREWQDHITKYHYPCTDEILSSLAELYVGDERFQKNLDHFGAGTAQFMHDAIKACL